MNSRFPLFLSMVLALSALLGGYYLSRKKSSPSAQAEIPFSRTSALSVEDYCRSKRKSAEDYTAVAVRGCPPRAPADVAGSIEAVAEYRNCSGIGLIPK